MGSEEEQKEALYKYQKASLEEMKRKRKKRRKKIIVLFFSLAFLLLFLSSFNLFPKIFSKQLRFYDVRLNDSPLQIAETIQSDQFLFGLIDLENDLTGTFYTKSYTVENKPYKLTLKSFSCFLPYKKKKIKISCSEQDWQNKYKYENNDTTYKMIIKKYKYEPNGIYRVGYEDIIEDILINKEKNSWKAEILKQFEIIYEGNFTSDITNFIKEQGVYRIQFDFTYKKNKGSIAVGIINDGKNIISMGSK